MRPLTTINLACVAGVERGRGRGDREEAKSGCGLGRNSSLPRLYLEGLIFGILRYISYKDHVIIIERWSNKPKINIQHLIVFNPRHESRKWKFYQNKITTVQTPTITAYVEVASLAVVLLARHSILPGERLLKNLDQSQHTSGLESALWTFRNFARDSRKD